MVQPGGRAVRTLVVCAIIAISVLAAGISSTQTFEPRTYARSSGGGERLRGEYRAATALVALLDVMMGRPTC